MIKTNEDSKQKLKASHCLLHPSFDFFKFILKSTYLKARNVNLNDQHIKDNPSVRTSKQIRIQNKS